MVTEAMVTEREVEGFHLVLCAPAACLAGGRAEELWQGRVAFETIADWLEGNKTGMSRWQAAVLRLSGEKLRRIEQATTDAALLALTHSCRTCAAAHVPQVHGAEQIGRDRGGFLRGVDCPPGVRFKQALHRGEVSLIVEARHWPPDLVPGTLPQG